MTTCAVVILNWNGEQMLRTFLPSVVEHTPDKGATLYVADNGSTDGSLAYVKETFPSVQCIALPTNYGFAEGYNQALKQIDATYYLLLNSDVEVTPHWLTTLLKFIDTHPEVAACQPKLRSWRQRENFEYAGACGGFIDFLGYPYCRGRVFEQVERDRGQYETAIPVFWASGAALLIRACDYWQCGGLDGTFFAHMEEIDLCWRLQLAGRKVFCVPQSVVYHVGGATLSKENPRKTFLNFRNNLWMLYKNLPWQQLGWVLLLRTVLDYVAALSFLFKGEWGNARAVVAARLAFWKSRSYRRRARRAVWQQVKCSHPPRTPFSILWQHLLRQPLH